MAAASVLICEDSGIYAAALRRTLEYDGDINVISVCGSAEEALAAIRRLRPDLITMDIELPGMDGLTAVEIIMGTRPMPIIVLTPWPRTTWTWRARRAWRERRSGSGSG